MKTAENMPRKQLIAGFTCITRGIYTKIALSASYKNSHPKPKLLINLLLPHAERLRQKHFTILKVPYHLSPQALCNSDSHSTFTKIVWQREIHRVFSPFEDDGLLPFILVANSAGKAQNV